ncbi:MAG: AarF/UbiB family protein [Blastocatellia bacterium]|nr:AarF/UbiB family protein [Blastocatellia bacterium]
MNSDENISILAASLSARWKELCAGYLPVYFEEATWRYSREVAPGDPAQGWKLHLSANLLTATETLARVAPGLRRRGILFKGPASLEEVRRINCGLSHGYSQVGKVFTIYPRTDVEARAIARQLHRLTVDLSAPPVPFDLRYRPGSCVYYRYGAFDQLEMETPEGTRVPAMRHPDGRLVPDLRDAGGAPPDWVSDPFTRAKASRPANPPASPLKTTFRAFRALSQRGKGGVYQAIDLSGSAPRFCLLKEGRRGGEVDWDGRDGHWRVRNEECVLSQLRMAGIRVPAIRASFEVDGHYYLVTEFLDGENLQRALALRRRRLSIPHVLQRAVQISTIVARIHAAGWVWRDCKPGNFLLTPSGELRPIDFEGACPVEEPDPLPWNTAPFSPPNLEIAPHGSRLPEDLYAIGATIYFLLTGRLIEVANPMPISSLRRNVPSALVAIVSDLLDPNPARRPSADRAAARFQAVIAQTRRIGQALHSVNRSAVHS